MKTICGENVVAIIKFEEIFNFNFLKKLTNMLSQNEMEVKIIFKNNGNGSVSIVLCEENKTKKNLEILRDGFLNR